jgi:hypothetical protein
VPWRGRAAENPDQGKIVEDEGYDQEGYLSQDGGLRMNVTRLLEIQRGLPSSILASKNEKTGIKPAFTVRETIDGISFP